MLAKEKKLVVLIDDHILFRKGVMELINKFENYVVAWEASNGKEFIKNLKICQIPDILLLDIAMPEMDGFETVTWLKIKFPEIRILVLTMFDKEDSIIRMLKLGVNGFILKDADPSELKEALDNIQTKGYYYSSLVTGTMAKNIKNEEKKSIIRTFK